MINSQGDFRQLDWLWQAIGSRENALCRHLPSDFFDQESLVQMADALKQLQPVVTPAVRGADVTFRRGNLEQVKKTIKEVFQQKRIAKRCQKLNPPLSLSASLRQVAAAAARTPPDISQCHDVPTLATTLEDVYPELAAFSSRWYDNWEGVRNDDHIYSVERHWRLLGGENQDWRIPLVIYLHDLGGKAVAGQHLRQEVGNRLLAQQVVATLQLAPRDQYFVVATIDAMTLPYSIIYERKQKSRAAYLSTQKLQRYLQTVATGQQAAAAFDNLCRLWIADAACYTLLGGNLPSMDAQFIWTLDRYTRRQALRLNHQLQQEVVHLKKEVLTAF